MFSDELHLEDLMRHLDLVRGAGMVLCRRLMAQGHKEFANNLMKNIYVHDASKFGGIEFQYMHRGPDVPDIELKLAISNHNRTNSHHPEHWGSFSQMPPLALAEMVCDWSARSTERGTGLRDWIRGVAIDRWKIDTASPQYKQMMEYVDLLLQDNFAKLK